MVKEIIAKDNPILRTVATFVPIADIAKPNIQRIVENMRVAVQSEDDGVALAAPQIGISLRIFVIAPRVFEETPDEKLDERSDPALPLRKSKDEHFVYINPEITKLSKRRAWTDEGCLSVRWLYGKVNRASKASVRAFDKNGKQFERGASGLLAQIFQHEIDHLDGILFTDKARSIVEIPPPKAVQ